MPKRMDKARLWIAAPIWVSLAVFIGIGPLWQQALSSSVDAPAPSIYSAAFDEGLMDVPSLAEWIGIGFGPGIAIASLIACILALTSRSYRTAALRATIGAVIAISIVDAIILTYDGDPGGIWESLLFNTLGAPLIWLFLTVLFYIRDRVETWAVSARIKDVIFGAAALGIATLISTSCWLIFQIFYNPAEVHFFVIANPPIEGFFVADEEHIDKKDEQKEGIQPFSILPRNSLVRRIEVNGLNRIGGNLFVEWRQLDMATKFEIRVWPNYDCPYPQALKNLPVGEPPFVFEAKSVNVGMTKGISQFLAETDEARSANLDVPIIAQYWIKADDEGKTTSIEVFIVSNDTISINPERSYRFYVGGPLSEGDGKASRSAKRELRFEVDGKPFSISAGGHRMLNNQALSCRAIKNVKLINSGNKTEIVAPRADTYFAVGALFEIREKPVPLEVFQSEQSRLSIKNANGWVEFSGFDFKRMTDRELGAGRGISISRNITRLTVNGQTIETSPEDALFTIADIQSRFDDEKLSVSGTAKALWLNNRRMNPTIWEGMGGWQIPFVTTLLGLLGLLARWLFPRILDFMRGRSKEPLVAK